MKKLISIISSKNCGGSPSLYEGIEILGTAESEQGEYIKNGVKKAKGKYLLLADTFNYADAHNFLSLAEKSNADVLSFEGGFVFKPALLKGVDLSVGKAYTEICAAINAKTLEKCDITPFTLPKLQWEFGDEALNENEKIIDEFERAKSKLQKDIYTFVFELILKRLHSFYVAAILAVRDKKLDAEKLIEFDEKLQKCKIMYLSLEKRFTAASLSKLRAKKFKINFLTAGKLKKAL